MKKFYIFFLLTGLGFLNLNATAQPISELSQKIKTEVESKNYAGAIAALRSLQNDNGKLFGLNNYDYLLARLSEKSGDTAGAAAGYQAVIRRNSVLSEYALWHLSVLMRANGNLMLERLYLKQLLTVVPDSVLSAAAQMRLARSYFESKDFPAAIGVLQKTEVSSPKSVLPSLLPGIISNTVVGNLTGNDPRTREALVLLGQSYEQNGQREQAREIFNRLYGNLPNAAMPDDFALAAVRGLDELDSGGQNTGTAPQLAEAEHLKRAAIYQFNRDFTTARLHYKAVVERFPQSGNVPDALFQIGRGFMQEGLLDEAIPWFERVQTEFPTHPISAEALSQAASAYARTRKTREAVARYQKYIVVYPEGDSFERAFLNIIDVWRDEGEFTKALEWAEKTQERFSGKTTAALAVFARAKIYMSQNDWARALASLAELQTQSDLGGTRMPGGTNKTEAAFLHAFVLEQLGRYPEAANEYLAIPDGRNEYYGWRATERLKAMAQNQASAPVISARFDEFKAAANQSMSQNQIDAARKAAQNALRLTNDTNAAAELLGIIRRAYAALPAYSGAPAGKAYNAGRQEVLKDKRPGQTEEDPHQVLADELLFLDLYDEAAPELEASLRQKGFSSSVNKTANNVIPNPLADFPPETAYTLALLYRRGDLHYRATAYIEPLWKQMPDDYLCELAPRESIEMLYPIPFADSLTAESAPRALDPRFVLSIMRQESRFRPDVKSVAAARGLMQFISSTADTVARHLGKANFQQDELYHPPTAILFGAQYLRDLFDLFPDQPQEVAASYNGGETNMARWFKRAHSPDPDRYVPEIVFSQSKDYVYRVMANYRVYRLLYDDKLKPLKTQ
jgi:soluble lytic murein transglycosylase